jgi:hypothetical protein
MTSSFRILLLGISCVGTALFSAAFFTSILNPGYVEEVAKDIIRLQVEKKVNEKIDSLDAKFLSSKAASLMKRQVDEIEIAKRLLKEKAPALIASVIAEMRNLDCECRTKIEKTIRDGIEFHIAAAAQAQDQLTAIIRTKYMEVAEKLIREFRIFTGTNALVFALLGIGAFLKRGAGIHLIPPALVMVVAAAITGYLYIFNQDWLHTILFSNYVGFTYVGYLSIVFAILCDILFNRAKVTTEVLNATFQAIGSSLQVVPC